MTDGGTKVKRTAKIDDPSEFYDDPTKDRKPFPLWWMHVDNKLTGNKDWFPEEAAEVCYITSRLAGNTATDILPYVDADNPHCITTKAGIKEHMFAIYDEPDRKRKAQEQYDRLRMMEPKTYGAEKSDYHAFKTAFVRLAAELRLLAADWKDAFERRLSPYLQRALATQFLDDSVDFTKIAILAQKVDNTNKLAEAESNRNKAPNNGGSGGNRGGRGGYSNRGGSTNSGATTSTNTTSSNNRGGRGCRTGWFL